MGTKIHSNSGVEEIVGPYGDYLREKAQADKLKLMRCFPNGLAREMIATNKVS